MSPTVANTHRIRPATEADLPGMAAVYGHAYPSQDFNPDWVIQRFTQNERFPFEATIVAEQDDQIVGMCILMPLETFTPGGGIAPMDGISTVAVSPVHRGLGIGSSMMRYCLQQSHSQQTPVVSCFPFEYRYYGRFGFAPVGRAAMYSVPPQALPAFPERRQVRLLDASDVPEVHQLHDTYYRGLGAICPRRSLHAWTLWWSWYRFQAVGYPATGPLEGILIYDYKTIADQRLQHEAIVRDFVAMTPAAERALYGYLASLDDQVRTVTMVVPEGDPLPFLWREQRLPDGKSVRRGDFTTGETIVGLTLRISHVPTALISRSYHDANGALVLKIDDPDLPENTGPWRLTFTDGIATVEATHDAPDLTCDVQTFASIWTGAYSLTTAWRWGRLQIEDEALLPLLDDAFRTATAPFVPDFDTF